MKERLKQVEAENAQRKAETERLKAERQAQALQAQVRQEVNEVQQYQAALTQNFFETYPEAERFIKHGDATEMQRLAAFDPMRYRQIVEAGVLVDDMVLGRQYRVETQKQNLAHQVANKIISTDPNYQGDRGRQLIDKHVNAYVEMRVAGGGLAKKSMPTSSAPRTTRRPMSRQLSRWRAICSAARTHARQTKSCSSRDPPGVARDMGAHHPHGLLATLEKKASAKQAASYRVQTARVQGPTLVQG